MNGFQASSGSSGHYSSPVQLQMHPQQQSGSANGGMPRLGGQGNMTTTPAGPSNSQTRLATPAAQPRPPVKIMKRQRIEYQPVGSQGYEFAGGWDAFAVEEQVTAAQSKRQKRSFRDLGLCDIRTLTMSLRCRIGAELSFALNSLVLLSAAPTTELMFNIGAYADLLEELVELLYDCVNGIDEEDDCSSSEDEQEDGTSALEEEAEKDDRQKRNAVARKGKPNAPVVNGGSTLAQRPGTSAKQSQKLRQMQIPPLTSGERERYSEAETQATLEEQQVQVGEAYYDAAGQNDTFAGLNRAELSLAVLGVFRNLSYNENNIPVLLKHKRVLQSCLQMTLAAERQYKPARRLELSQAQRLQARKDSIQLLGNLGDGIQLDRHPGWVAMALLELIDYFMEPNEQANLTSAPMTTPAGTPLSAPKPCSAALDLSLFALSKILLSDFNREAFSVLPTESVLLPFLRSKFYGLLDLLPATDTDFHTITAEAPLLRKELIALCLFNIVYIAPLSLRKEFRSHPGTVRALVRVVKKLWSVASNSPTPSGGSAASPQQKPYLVLCQRCIEILRLLSEDEAQSSSAAGGSSGGKGTNGSGTAWFGSFTDPEMGPEGEVNHRPRPSLAMFKTDLVELLACPVSDKAAFAALVDCL